MKGNKGYQGPPTMHHHHHHAPVQQQVHYAFIGMCTKCCLTSINIFIGVLGFIILAVGVFGLYASTVVDERVSYELEFIYQLTTNICGTMVPLGTALMCVAVAGCIGACQENLPLLKVYMWVLALFLIIEICVIFGSLMVVWKAAELVSHSLPNSLIEDYRPNTYSVLETLQSQIECCGLSFKGYQDYNRNPIYNCYDMNQATQRCSVPGSCCKTDIGHGAYISATTNDSFSCAQGVLSLEVKAAQEVIFTEGCMGTLVYIIRMTLLSIAAFILVCAVIKMYVLYQVRTLLNQVAMMHYNVYG